jgi:ubiquitin-protein ligase
MAEPNPDDALMHDIADEFKYNRALFLDNAARSVKQHAMAALTPNDPTGDSETAVP